MHVTLWMEHRTIVNGVATCEAADVLGVQDFITREPDVLALQLCMTGEDSGLALQESTVSEGYIQSMGASLSTCECVISDS